MDSEPTRGISPASRLFSGLRSRLTLGVLAINLIVAGISVSILELAWKAGAAGVADTLPVETAFAHTMIAALGAAAVAGLVVGTALTALQERRSEPTRDEATEAVAHDLSLAFQDSAEARLLLRDGEIVIANPAAATLFGVPSARLTGTVTDALSEFRFSSESGAPLDRHTVIDLARECPSVVCIERPDGSSRWAEVRAAEGRGENLTLFITARDITEERRVEALRAEAISIITHDLRAPLTVISGYLELLDRPLSEDKRLRAAASAKVSADRMCELLEDLLSATRAEELFTPVTLLPVDLSKLAEEVATSFEHVARQRITAVFRAPTVVLGEERRLRQAIVNLVMNAIQHTPDSSTITLTVRPVDGQVVLLVEDDGPGIPTENRQIVFSRFTRLPGEPGRRPGFGIGLYIVRAIVESHGGSVRIEDRDEGPGVRFVISLPAAPPAE